MHAVSIFMTSSRLAYLPVKLERCAWLRCSPCVRSRAARTSSFTYTHEKCVILDGTSVWIMTMNLTYSSPTSNREYLAIDTDTDDIAEAEQIFQADFAAASGSFTGKLLVAPVNARDGITQL